MYSVMSFSGFVSNFSYAVPPTGFIDILTSVLSVVVGYNNNGTIGYDMSANYFYLGGLLIQYSYKKNTTIAVAKDTSIDINIPIAYDNLPFVMVTNYGSNGTAGLTNITKSQFTVYMGGTTNYYPNWLTIGPKPYGTNLCSGLISNFTATTGPQSGYNDLLSSVVSTDIVSPTIGNATGCYFYLGGLLIQYTYIQGNISDRPSIAKDAFATFNFPIPYSDTTIPNVFACTVSSNASIGITSITNSQFTVKVGATNGKFPNWIAIGPRP